MFSIYWKNSYIIFNNLIFLFLILYIFIYYINMLKKKGGSDMTFCMCGKRSIGCYGSVQCDCSNPEIPRCLEEGLPINQNNNKSLIKKEIKTVLNNYKNHMFNMQDKQITYIINKLKTVEIMPLDKKHENINIDDIITFKGKTKTIKVKITNITCHKKLETALHKGTLKKTFPETEHKYVDAMNKLSKLYKNNNNNKFVNLHFVFLKDITH